MTVPCPHCGTPTPPLPQPSCVECGRLFEAGFYAVIRQGKVGDYRPIRHLGSGGTGEVFEAEQVSMGRRVALKVLHPEFVRDKAYVKRFFYEVRMLAKVSHPNVITAIEAGVDGDFVFFSMRLEEGADLSQHLVAGRTFSRREILHILRETASALEHCWQEFHMIHRDIKPANLFLTSDGHIKLMDMGISKQISSRATGTMTLHGMMVGTPNYVSPEQARALPGITWSSDMYSLGVTAFELFTGLLPYRALSVPEVLEMQVEWPVPNPRTVNPTLPHHITQMVMRMMQKDPHRRYPSWQTFLREIDRINARPRPPSKPLRDWYREFALRDPVRLRHLWLAVIAIGIVVLSAAVAALLLAVL